MLLTGIDLVEIARIKRSMESTAFYNKAFGDVEKEYLRGLNGDRKYQSAAAFFAAKEAFSKAFGGILTPNTLADVQVAHKQNGKPYFVLSGKAEKKVGNAQIDLSISHTQSAAAAVVVVLEDE